MKLELSRYFPDGVTVQVWKRVAGHAPPAGGPPTLRVLASAVVAAQPHPTVIPGIAGAKEPTTAQTAYPGESADCQPLWISAQVGGQWKHITAFGRLTLEQHLIL